MLFLSRLLLSVAILCWSASASASSPAPVAPEPKVQPAFGSVSEPPVTLAELEQRALQSHPGLFEALAKIDAAVGRSWQAGLPPNPTAGYVSSEVGADGTAGQQGAFVGQQFVRGGKLQLDRAVACRTVQRLRQDFQSMRNRVLTDVRAAFYELLWLQRRQKLLERFRDTNRQAADLARQSFQVGDSARSDVLLAEIELEQTISEIVTVNTQLEARWRGLARLVGDLQLRPTELSTVGIEPSPKLDWDEAVALIGESPRVAAAAADLARARLALRRAVVEPVPNVQAQLSVQYDYGLQDTFAGVQIGMPIPKRNRNQGGIYAARADIRAAEQRLVRLQYQLERELSQKYGVYHNAKLQLQRLTTKIVPKAEEVVRIAFEAYGAGEISMSDVLNAQRSLLRATLRQQDAQQELQSAFVQIKGFLLSDSLAAES